MASCLTKNRIPNNAVSLQRNVWFRAKIYLAMFCSIMSHPGPVGHLGQTYCLFLDSKLNTERQHSVFHAPHVWKKFPENCRSADPLSYCKSKLTFFIQYCLYCTIAFTCFTSYIFCFLIAFKILKSTS